MKPSFSILIANYNNGKYFTKCYESVISQTYENWECIIVDDASTDDSVAIIKDLIGDDSRFKLYHNEKNQGCGYTKKRCVELATSEICGFLDPDDELLPEAVELMIAAHLDNQDVGLIHSNKLRCFVSENREQIDNRGAVASGDPSFININGEISHFATFKIAVYNKTEGINPFLQRAVDLDLYLKLYEITQVLHLDKVLYRYNITTDGISTYENQEKALYWRWLVTADAASRRKVNFENEFAASMTARSKYNALEQENTKLRKYISFLENDTLLNKVIRKISGKKPL